MTKENSLADKIGENQPKEAENPSQVGTLTKAASEKRVPKRWASPEEHTAFIEQFGA